MRNIKGMSPLIATVLLIAFAVALGAMIMNWSTSVEEPAPSAGSDDPCTSVAIELNEVFGKTLFCYQDGAIRFNVINTGTRELSGIQLRTLDANLKEVKKDIPESRIVVGGTFDYDFAYPDKSGKVHAELVPYVMKDAQSLYCVKRRIVQDILPECANG
jgi:flagellin-like protein